tara:strand:- start:563 stop:1687 length:1125 start_codon:yes stop_codon:yes gene_type:complete
MDANVPRLDYSDGGCPKLLTEDAFTNVCLWSEDFTKSEWTKSNVILQGGFTSPSGSKDATKVVISGGNADHSLYQNLGSAVPYCLNSFFVKKAEYKKISVSPFGSSGNRVVFDIDEGYVDSVIGLDGDYGIEKHADGWFRVWVSSALVGGSTASYILMTVVDDNGANVFAGDGGFYIWGAFANTASNLHTSNSSYIPTNGSIATTQADQVINAGNSSTFNSESGVLFADVKFKNQESPSMISLNSGGVTSRLDMYSYQGNSISFEYNKNSTLETSVLVNTPIELKNKFAMQWGVGKTFVYVNGIKYEPTTSTDVTYSTNALSSLDFRFYNGNFPLQGKTKSIQHFDSLSDAEMEQLTGYDSYSAMTSQFNFNIL